MEAQTELLRQFVNLCKSNPSILHEPRFAFYKNYLERLILTENFFKKFGEALPLLISLLLKSN